MPSAFKDPPQTKPCRASPERSVELWGPSGLPAGTPVLMQSLGKHRGPPALLAVRVSAPSELVSHVFLLSSHG